MAGGKRPKCGNGAGRGRSPTVRGRGGVAGDRRTSVPNKVSAAVAIEHGDVLKLRLPTQKNQGAIGGALQVRVLGSRPKARHGRALRVTLLDADTASAEHGYTVVLKSQDSWIHLCFGKAEECDALATWPDLMHFDTWSVVSSIPGPPACLPATSGGRDDPVESPRPVAKRPAVEPSVGKNAGHAASPPKPLGVPSDYTTEE